MTNDRPRRSTTAKNTKATAKEKGKGKATGETSKPTGKRAPTANAPSAKKLHLHIEEPISTSQEHPSSTRLEFTDAQHEDFKCFRMINIHPTRFMSRQFLEKAGLKEDVKNIIEAMGLTKFMEVRSHLYPEIVRDFFATVELVYKKPRKPSPNEGTLKFIVWGNAYSISIADICEAYGFHYGSETKFKEFSSADIFWDTIATGTAAGSPKATLIRNPAIRYVHKLLANTLFARKQSGAVKQGELWLLFKGLRGSMTDEDGAMFENVDKGDVNLGCVFARELVKIRKWGRHTSEPHCLIGSVLTVLFDKVGIPLQNFYQEPKRGSLDRDYFVVCHFLEETKDDTEYRYLYTTRQHTLRTIPLPDTEKTSITRLSNILFEHEGTTPNALALRRHGQTPSDPQQAAPDQDDIQAPTDPWELPELPIKPKTAREKIFFNAYKMQKRINKMAKNKFNWLKSKLKKIPGYVSDEDEFIAQEEERERTAEQEAQGEQAGIEEGRASYHGARDEQEYFGEDQFDYHARYSYQGDYGTGHFYPATYDLGGSSSFRH